MPAPTLADLLAHGQPSARPIAEPFASRVITGLTADSRAVVPGSLFAAMPGAKLDGTAFIGQAVEKGAVAILAPDSYAGTVPDTVALIRAGNIRKRFSEIAARFYPRQPGTIAAVTGTNGKTSVASFTRQIWAGLGLDAASLGTLGVDTPIGHWPTEHTTPDPVTLHHMLDRLVGEAAVTHLAFEASSHGLAQFRLDGVRLTAGAFTNISRDHLDYHPTFEDYLAAKLRLFSELLPKGAPVVVDTDEPGGRAVADAARAAKCEVFTVGSQGAGIRLFYVIREGLNQRLRLSAGGRQHDVLLPLVGDFQVKNALVAAGLAIATGSDVAGVLHQLGSLKGARGRLDLAGCAANGAPIFIDYAHTPDGLEKAILSLKPYAKGRIVVVFGCGGDRDKGKRPMMGAIAARLAHHVIITDDNPRTEDAAAIRREILAACPKAQEIADRGEAIAAAIAGLGANDVALIAGKGHETGQIIGSVTHPFSDHAVVAAVLGGGQAELPLIAPSAPVVPVIEQPVIDAPIIEQAITITDWQAAVLAHDVLFTAEALLDATAGAASGPALGAISGISIDTRTLQPGDLFVAIKGDTHDGHDFVAKAFEAGAAAALVAESFATPVRGPVIRVPDPLQGLEALARAARTRSTAKIIAVTGSVGKTSTKEALRHVLSRQGPTHASVKSFNNHWGVPLSLARLPATARLAVFEIGMNHAGEITPLTLLVRPHAAIITTVEPVHIEHFDSVEGIADAKAEIFAGLEPGGVAILNRDNPHFERLRRSAKAQSAARIISFGQHPASEVFLSACDLGADQSDVAAEVLGQHVEFTLSVAGRHMVQNALAVLAGVAALGGDVAQAAVALGDLAPVDGRGRRFTLGAGNQAITLIDESYNANPASMRAAIAVTGQVARAEGRRAVAVLGDMLELGGDGPRDHAELAGALIDAGIMRVFTAGPLMAHLDQTLPHASRAGWAETSEALVPQVLAALRGGDVIMVKGSLGSRMAVIVNALKAAYAEPE